MILNYLCPPALLYAVIMLIYLVLELSNENYHQAFVKAIIGIIFTCILQAFCQMNIGIVSWILVMIPIIFYTYITLLTFFVFGLNPNNKFKFSPMSAPSPAPTPAPSPPTPAPQPKKSPSPNLDQWVPSNHISSTPITTSLYTPSFVPTGEFKPSPSYSPIIPDASNADPWTMINNLLPLKKNEKHTTSNSRQNSLPKNERDKLSSNSTDNSSPLNFPGICNMYNDDIPTCMTYSVCSWAIDGSNSRCVPYYNYQNNVNALVRKCNNIENDKCKNDKNCDFYENENKCNPSMFGMVNMLNKNDCINFHMKNYDKLIKGSDTSSDKIKKDQELISNSFKDFDTKGCGIVSQSIMEKLYGIKT